jgi:putative protease
MRDRGKKKRKWKGKERKKERGSSATRQKRAREGFSGKPELLAPAGNLESFFSALSAGADAVYIGLPRFNARIRADNFSIPDLAKLIPLAHSRGKKVYITVNTQILEEELPSFIDLVSGASLFSPDAFIVGDLGAVEILRTHFPLAEIHASTMMGNFNARILDIYARLGIRRAILERHLEYEQVREAVRRSPIDVELFVHGAMCFSYSGRCLFSSYLGGKSGNRGECVQPCRRVFEDETRSREGSYFSAKDLSLMRMLPELIKLGVRGFKIEGRMRGADYVHDVVSAYRKAIDKIYDGKADEGIGEGEALLTRVIGREKAGGVISGEDDSSTVSSETAGAVGEFIGKIDKIRRPFMLVMTGIELKKGERLRVQDHRTGKGTGFTLISMEKKKSDTWIKVPFAVKEGDLVFRVSPRRDRKRATESASSAFARLPSSGIQFTVSVKGSIITVYGSMDGFEKRHTFRVEGRKKQERFAVDDVKKALADSYGGDFPLGKVVFQGSVPAGIAAGDIVRAFEKASKNFDKSLYLDLKKKRISIISSLKIRGARRHRKPTALYAAVETVRDAEMALKKVDYVIVTVTKSLLRDPHKLMPLDRDNLILSLPPWQSDALLTFYRGGIKNFTDMGFGKFVVPDIGWVKVFKEAGFAGKIELISDHSVYAFNTASCVLLQRLGISRFILPLETTFKNLVKEAKFLKGLGILPVFVNVPLMVSRLRPFRDDGEQWMYSKMGEKFKAVTESRETVVYSEKKYSASGYIDRFMELGVTDFLVDLRNVDSREAKYVLDHVVRDREIPETSTFNLFRENF